jgi:hypothetical protein
MDPEEHRLPHDRHYRSDRHDYWDDRKAYADRELRRLSDEDLQIVRHEYDDRDHRRHRDHDHDDEAPPKRNTKPLSDDERDSKTDKVRDKVSAGLGIAAATVGLKSALKRPDKDKEDASPSRRREDEESSHHKRDESESRLRAARKEPMLGDEDYEIVEHPSEKPRKGTEPGPGPSGKKREDHVAPPPRDHSSSGDEGKTKIRRRQRASTFDPNDTAGLAALKAQLAATEGKEKTPKNDVASPKEPSPDRRSSPGGKDDDNANSSALVVKEDRDPSPPSRDERQVRVVPPPNEPAEKKPLKGILKPPKPQFPEEPNPVREGVAPHKDDKTKANVPPGARWTKISRKMVNPEALTIGKERFEVRDDFVIVLRVLSKEEIQAYATATQQLRGRSPHSVPSELWS